MVLIYKLFLNISTKETSLAVTQGEEDPVPQHYEFRTLPQDSGPLSHPTTD